MPGARTAVVAGGTGLVGGIVARGLLTADWTVVVPARSPGRLAPLQRWAAEQDGPDTSDRLVGVPLTGLPADRREAVRAAAGVPDAVVAAIGGWRLYPDLLDVPEADWQAALDAHLTAHLQALQAFAPLLAEATAEPGRLPAYVTLNGVAAVQPLADAGPISITGAAQRMLLDVAAAGRLAGRVRFHEVSLLAAVAGDDRNVDPAEELAPHQVAEAVLGVLDDPSSPTRVRIGGQAPD